MTTCYVVMHSDRHTDIEPQVFQQSDDALNHAKHIIMWYANDGTTIEEIVIDQPDWLYYATYGYEGDAVWVLERELR
jgi:hypothetical protein